MITKPYVIYIDHRETSERRGLLKEVVDNNQGRAGNYYEISKTANMEAGDVVYGTLAIELKKMYDFVGSIKDGTIFRQVRQMRRAGFNEIKIIITREPKEKDDDGGILFGLKGFDDYGMHPHAILGAIASLSSPKYGCTIVMVDTEEQQMYLVYKCVEKHNFKAVDLSKAEVRPKATKKDIDLNILLLADGVGKRNAMAVLKVFGSVAQIRNVSAKEIADSVFNVGIRKAEAIKKVTG